MKFLKIAGLSILVLTLLRMAGSGLSSNIDKSIQPQTVQASTVKEQTMTDDKTADVNPQNKPLKVEDASSQSITNNNEQGDPKLADKLDKIKTLQELQKQKNFMLIIAQDDLEHYSWGETSEYPDIWRQAYLKYNINGNRVMLALQYDLDTYLTYGNSDYALVWASADYIYEAYKAGKLKTSMTEQDYQKFVDNLNAVNKRLGFIYSKREYTSPPNNYSQTQQAPY